LCALRTAWWLLHGSTAGAQSRNYLGLSAGQQHAWPPVRSQGVACWSVKHADELRRHVLARDGAVIASFAERRAVFVQQLHAAAAKVGGGARRRSEAGCPARMESTAFE